MEIQGAGEDAWQELKISTKKLWKTLGDSVKNTVKSTLDKFKADT